jgi:hypothetical protein
MYAKAQTNLTPYQNNQYFAEGAWPRLSEEASAEAQFNKTLSKQYIIPYRGAWPALSEDMFAEAPTNRTPYEIN